MFKGQSPFLLSTLCVTIAAARISPTPNYQDQLNFFSTDFDRSLFLTSNGSDLFTDAFFASSSSKTCLLSLSLVSASSYAFSITAFNLLTSRACLSYSAIFFSSLASRILMASVKFSTDSSGLYSLIYTTTMLSSFSAN